ncbi:DNA-dependent protein kinase catalytic subunit-like [Culicoides brevitarsis]|uniref:DNA-dependent protein kinase catalytic subunit-like n=1 Tax=Culicoides brevitarsis TaxID=469753 RepID=UPI00307C4B46
MLRNLVQSFRRTLKQPEANFTNIRIAIRGFGTLSKACRLLLEPEFLNEVLTLVLQRIRYTDYKDDATRSKQLLEHLPDYVNSLSEIMTNMDHLTAIQLTYLENIIVELMRDFYYLSQSHHELVVVSILSTLANVQKMGENVYNDFIDRIVFQGVVWACDKCLIYDTDWSEERDWKENVTYRSYLPLWQGLIDEERLHPNFDRPKIARKLLDILLNTLFQIIGKLNFTLKKRTYRDEDGIEQEFNFCDPNIDLEPVKPQDFHIFVNIVDLYSEILKNLPEITKKSSIAPRWLGHACDELIKKILEYPLISGFVKLLEVLIKIGKETNYFSNLNEPFRVLLSAFVKEIIQRVTQSTAELQLSYLKLIFVCPVVLLKDFVRKMTEIYLIAFEFGKNLPVLWIASMALRSLEELIEVIEDEKRKKLLKKVLPALESFLSSSGDATVNKIKTEIVRSGTKGGKRTNIKRKFEISEGMETELLKFQKRIVLFLGKLSLEECQFMLHREPESLELVKWEPKNHLDLKIQANVFKIDQLIPRISHLALFSSDRKTKVAACEFLHTIVLYLIGTNNLSTVIWEKLSPKIIELGVDSDAAVQEMFEPLLYQIVHYLSKPDFIHLKGTETFFEALLHLISHSSNNSIQDLSAKLLREFVSWSLRHVRRDRVGATPANLKNLFNRLMLYCTDADNNNRKAAVLTFNNLFRITRQEKSLVSELWIELFYCYCTNYVMTENFYLENHQKPELEQHNIALDNFMKVFVVQDFTKFDPNRRFPAVFDARLGLKSVALWVLSQCSSINQRNYRLKCIEMFSVFAKTLNPDKSVINFVTENNLELIKVFEEANGSGLSRFPEYKNTATFLTTPQQWLATLLTALDGYFWVIHKKLDASIEQNLLQESSTFLVAIEFFMQNMILADSVVPSSSQSDISTDSLEMQLNLNERETIKNLKQKIIIKIFEILTNLLLQETFPTDFLRKNLTKIIEIVKFLIFEPEKLDFPTHESSETEIGRKTSVRFVLEVHRKLNSSVKFVFLGEFHLAQISSFKELMMSFEADIHKNSIPYEHHSKAKGLLLSLSALPSSVAELELLLDQLFTKIFTSLKRTLLESTEMEVSEAVNPNPSIKDYISRLLKIVLLSKNASTRLKSFIFDETILKTDDTVVKHGEFFKNIYKNVVLEFVCRNVEDFVQEMFSSEDEISGFYQILQYLCDFCDFAHKKITPEHAAETKKSLVKAILKHLPSILSTSRKVEDSELQIVNLISHLMMIFNENPLYMIDSEGLIQSWFMEIMSRDQTLLDTKTKLLVLLPCFTGSLSKIDLQQDLDACLVEHLKDKHFPHQSHEFEHGSIQHDSYIACFQAILEALVVTKSPVILMFVVKISASDPKHVIEHELRQAITKYASGQVQETLLADIFYLFDVFRSYSYTHDIRTTILKRFLLGILKASPENVAKLFFKTAFRDIWRLVKAQHRTKHALIDKMAGFQLLEILFGICTKDFLDTPGNIEADEPPMRATIFACRDEFLTTNHDPDLAEYFRKAQCAVFNCLCTTLANHQTNGDLYYKMLFKNPQIWSNIMNVSDSQVYQMTSQEVDDYPVVRRRIVAIRNIKKLQGVTENRHFHATTSIYASSLSQDVLRVDFSNTIVRSNVPEEPEKELAMTPFGEIALEKILINDHECMANICAVIHHMRDKEITNFGFKVVWIESLCGMMVEHPVLNVRRFIAKVVDNCRDVFKNAVATVYPAILKFLIQDFTMMNAFVTDLCVLLLEWSEVYTIQSQEEQQLASKLVELLIKKANSKRKDILRANLEIFKNFVELWKGFLVLPYQEILLKVAESELAGEMMDVETKGSIYGIHLSAILLSAGLIPWNEDTKVNFFAAVRWSMFSKYAVEYQPAGQLYGMCLREEFKDKTESAFLENPDIVEFISQLKIDLRQDQNNALDIIYGIQKYCVTFLKPFTNLITDKIPLAMRKIKLKYLEMFLAAMEFYENHLFKEIIYTINIRQLLKQPDFKIMALHIINRALPLITPTEVLFLFTDVTALINDASSQVREIVYEILIFIYKNLAGKVDLRNIDRTGAYLLEGILDSNPEIQARLIKFWSDPEQLPLGLDKRMEKLFCQIYKHDAKNFLTAATLLLLHPAIVDPTSALPLFHYTPPEDVKHVEKRIDTNWRRNASLTRPPLFVETKTLRQTIQTLSSQVDGIRVTQTADKAETTNFTPTIDPNDFFTSKNVFGSNIVTQDSFLVRTQQQPSLSRRSNFVTETQETQKSGFSHLRQRFLKDESKIQKEKALKAINFRYSNEQKRRSERRENELRVTLYRRYRDGDFPDLTINSLALLLPLQALLRHDKQVTRQVFTEIFAVSQKIARNEVLNQLIGNQTNSIMDSFVSGDATFIATLLDIAITNAKTFKISPGAVKNVAKASNNLTLGILYLEERLNVIENGQEDHWAQLAELYRCLSEHDVLNGIFANKINVDNRLPEAIQAMAENKFEHANDIWIEILGSVERGKPEEDFCFQAHFDCLAALGDWDGLVKNVRRKCGELNEVWDNGFKQEVLLPHLVSSETHLILEELHDNDSFLTHLVQWRASKDRWEILKQNFSEELAMLLVAQGDFHQARVIAEQNIQNFLLEWANLDILCDKIRLFKLEKVRILSELFTTIEKFFLRPPNEAIFNSATKFYELSLPSKTDSTIFWDTLITYRSFFVQKLNERTIDEDLEMHKNNISLTVDAEKLKLFDVALKQANYGLAEHILDRIRTSIDIKQLEIHESYLEIRKAAEKENVGTRLNDLLLACARLKKAQNDVQSSLSLAEIGEMLLEVPENERNHRIFNEFCEKRTPSSVDLQEKVIFYLKTALERNISSQNVTEMAENFMKIADFSYFCLESPEKSDKIRLERDIVQYTLKAMQLGNKKARDLFARLLQLEGLSDKSVSNTFISEASKVPDWLFLEWIPQILCHLDLQQRCCLDIIVEKLNRAFSSELIYPLRFKILSNLEDGKQVRPFLTELLDRLMTPLVKRFINGLSLICLPLVKVKNSVQNLQKLMQSRPETQVFHDAVAKEMQILFKNTDEGSEYRKIMSYKTHFEQFLQQDPVTLRDSIVSSLQKMFETLNKSTKSNAQEILSTENLSPWLANYHFKSGTESISIPGQFTRPKSKPHSNEHVQIIKIDANVTIFPSIRRPIRIKFYGSDGKEYTFLTKYGEDSRQDQRIQQLLSIMSEKMGNDRNCRLQNLKIVTYGVTPIDKLFGLYNWVGNTIQLRDALFKSYERHENGSIEDLVELIKPEQERLLSSVKIYDVQPYALTALNNEREVIASNFRKIIEKVPRNLLKNSLLDYASNYEKYYALKANFVRSLASMAVSHWILGIGDRHLSNILIDTKSFTLIGIDFGHAFGTATRDLPIPELIPFRLTPQMQVALEPIGVFGQLERCMIHAMRCLRAEQKILKSCMDLFVKEAISEWLTDTSPEARVNIACRKLLGVNPAKVTKEELNLNKLKARGYMEGYKKLLKTSNYYGREEKLSVEAQVRKLIEQATDEALLGVTYIGWTPHF